MRQAGRLLLLLALSFNLLGLAPETRIGVLAPNDSALHLALSERMAVALGRGEPFLDPWVSEWSLGYPVWRSYQPLPHLIGAAAIAAARRLCEPASAFALLFYLLVATLPLSFYLAGRRLGLGPLGSGLAALLSLLPSAEGDLGRYGLSYGAMIWRGSGLFTQVVALHALLATLGVVLSALDTGRGRPRAGLALALTALSHIVFGYVAFLASAILALVGARQALGARLVRLLGVVLLALLLLAWFVVPLLLVADDVNHSRWEDAVKWDSYGAKVLLGHIARGTLFDAWRWPVLTPLLILGALGTLLPPRGTLVARLWALTLAFLALYMGREAWGHLLLLAAVPADLHIHRLQAAFELFAVLLAAHGLERILAVLAERRRALAVAAAALLAAAGGYLLRDRWLYLEQNREWGEASLASWRAERSDLAAALASVRLLLADRPGRVSAGKAAEWGADFRIGSLAAYAFVTREHLDQVSFLYHSMSRTSDIMVLRREEDLAHAYAFAVRAVLAPIERRFPEGFRRRSVHGRFAVWEASPEGYFGLVHVLARYRGPRETEYEPSSAWLDPELPWLRHGAVAALGPGPEPLPEFGRWQPFPAVALDRLPRLGEVLEESKVGETYRARVDVLSPAHAFLKITWHPDLEARVDGRKTRLLRVTPGFGAVPLAPGRHEVEVRYAPGPLKPALFAAGLAAFLLGSLALRPTAPWERIQERLAASLQAAVARLDSPRRRSTALLVLLAILAFRPLFRGRLVDGHDAAEYPPRLVEFARVLGDLQLPPVWAPDLGNGHGQPLFQFAPPLVYAAAYPFHRLGLRLADSLQLGLFLLHLAGAGAVYRLARGRRADRAVALGVAAAWMFSPYVALDLFVRTAFAEAAAVAVSPLALWALLRLLDRPGRARLIGAGAAIALVPLAHNAAALLLFPALALVAAGVALGRAEPAGRRRILAAAAGALALALGFSAFFWIPALAEKDFVKTELLRQDFLHWSQHVVEPAQLLWSRWGHGLSLPGAGDGMSFALGPLHLLLALASLLVLWRRGERGERWLHASFLLCALLGAWLATGLSAFVWERIATLQYMAYPWRALSLPGLFLPLLALPVLVAAGPRLRPVLVALLVVFNLPHTEPKGYLTFDDEFYLPESIGSRHIKTSTREEYEPRWASALPPYSPERLRAQGGGLQVEIEERRSSYERLAVRAAAPMQVETTVLYYPGMSITVDGIEAALEPVEGHGTMRFQLPAGEHRVEIRLRPTPLRRAAAYLSLLLWLLAAAALLRRA